MPNETTGPNGSTREQHTYCRICEAMCGVIATVDDGKIVNIRPDKEAMSEGFICTKASAMVEVTYDDDRVLYPMKRVGGPGEFERVSWDEALDDIAARLGAIRARDGGEAIAAFTGNPVAFSHSATLATDGFMQAVGGIWKYSIQAEDVAARFAANSLLYNSSLSLLKPDLWRTKFAILIGTNPFVAKSCLFVEPQVRKALDSVIERGGRVVVIDPRRSETARRYDHVAPIPGTDSWLLLGMLKVIFTRNLVDEAYVADHTSGFEELCAWVDDLSLETCATNCGVESDVIEELATSFATAESALVHGRTGSGSQMFGTLTNVLQDTLMAVTGNIEREGGGVYGWSPIDLLTLADTIGMAEYNSNPSRVRGGLPDVGGVLPATALPADIVTPGKGRVRALMTMMTNPVLTSGAASALPDALEDLELHFSLDFYMNETNRYADYILPAPGFYERADIPAVVGGMLRPAMWATEAVIEPLGESRDEFDVVDDIVRRMGRGGAYSARPMRFLARLGFRPSPRSLIDLMLRISSAGDLFGLRRSGLSWKKLTRDHPHGVRLRTELPTDQLAKTVKTPDGRINLFATPIKRELERLRSYVYGDDYPLRMIGLREIRSQNSWMHNAERLTADGQGPSARVHPKDAADAGIADGDQVDIVSKSGRISLPVQITDEMRVGTIAVPHGWGHDGGWKRANSIAGVNSNELVSDEIDDLEALAAMSVLNGIPIRIEVPA